MKDQNSIPMGGQQAPDLSQTSVIKSPDGKVIFQSGILLRSVSRFLLGTDEDALVPIQCFYEPTSGKIISSSLPKEIRNDYKDFLFEGEAETNDTENVSPSMVINKD